MRVMLSIGAKVLQPKAIDFSIPHMMVLLPYCMVRQQMPADHVWMVTFLKIYVMNMESHTL